MTGSYNFPLVALSYVIAMVASYVALDLAGRVTAAQGKASYYWLAGGAVAMGTGIWSMHFVGMLAFHLPIPIAYDPSITVVSMLIAILVSGLALFTVSRNTLTWVPLALAGTIMGFGIATMHYTGMTAMLIAPGIIYDPVLLVASIVIAIAASCVALWIAFQLRSETVVYALWKKLGSALVMGAAIVGMHYTGMAAAIFAPNAICTAPLEQVDNVWLALVIAAFAGLFLAATMLISVIDARLARHLGQTNRRLEEARFAAESASRAKSEFLAQMSHEFRTPLNAILGFSEMIRDQLMGPNSGAYVEYAANIHDAGRHLLGIISNILDLTKVEAGHLEMQEEIVDVFEVISKSIAVIRPLAEKGGLSVSADLPERLPNLIADSAKLRQILINLLSNAVKFTPDGGSIAVKSDIKSDGTFVLSVSDTGIGMSAEQIPVALEPFGQIDSSLSRKHGGTGLGLPLSKRLVLQHGGTFEIKSALNEGTTIQISFPSARVRFKQEAAEVA